MGHEVQDGAAIEWLLASDEPATRMMARRDLLDLPASGEERTATLQGPKGPASPFRTTCRGLTIHSGRVRR